MIFFFLCVVLLIGIILYMLLPKSEKIGDKVVRHFEQEVSEKDEEKKQNDSKEEKK